MIILPSRNRLNRRASALYAKLLAAMQHASVSQVEDVMRRIHIINLKILNYGTQTKETVEIFEPVEEVED
jgi:hypothetical protein